MNSFGEKGMSLQSWRVVEGLVELRLVKSAHGVVKVVMHTRLVVVLAAVSRMPYFSGLLILLKFGPVVAAEDNKLFPGCHLQNNVV